METLETAESDVVPMQVVALQVYSVNMEEGEDCLKHALFKEVRACQQHQYHSEQKIDHSWKDIVDKWQEFNFCFQLL